jgi:Tol biopolymer transport system component
MYTTTFTLNVINADGSGLQKIDTGSAQVISPSGWLPDNQTIVYSVMGGDGFTYKTHNLQSGETKELFTIQHKAGYGSISPDGQWIVFADWIFGANNWGIFISRLDGSERKLVAEPEVPTAFASVWGPDGQWLIINTTKPDETEMPVLVNPFTCQLARLPNINGPIESWSP